MKQDETEDENPMKIANIQTYKFSVPTGQEIRDPHSGELLCSASKPWLFLKIETDAGISGWGEGTGEWLVPSVEATLHEWSSFLVGRDPLPGPRCSWRRTTRAGRSVTRPRSTPTRS